ncbi:hypothetical protein [Actinokineospora fastidiosa]|nr:hypothetical protein [Actinokineospora fastidiosa]
MAGLRSNVLGFVEIPPNSGPSLADVAETTRTCDDPTVAREPSPDHRCDHDLFWSTRPPQSASTAPQMHVTGVEVVGVLLPEKEAPSQRHLMSARVSVADGEIGGSSSPSGRPVPVCGSRFWSRTDWATDRSGRRTEDHRWSCPTVVASNEPIMLSGGRAQQILQRRINQSVAEYEVLNMLEQSWVGTCTHIREGYNIGKPCYGYKAKKYRHPNPVKAMNR